MSAIDSPSACVYVDSTRAELRSVSAIASTVGDGLQVRRHGVTAAGSVMVHPAGKWRETIQSWLDARTNEALVAISNLLDGRTVDRHPGVLVVFSAVHDARPRPTVLRLLLRLAPANKPPTGFLRDIVVEQSGEHRGSFDIKQAGLLAIVGIARYAGLAAVPRARARCRVWNLRELTGNYPESDATTLEEAWRR
jgi:CBS domain-containing protein